MFLDHSLLINLDYANSGHTGFAKEPYSTTIAPSVNNDSVDTAGLGITFQAGDFWANTTKKVTYYCIDATPTAAIWKEEVNTTGNQIINIASPTLSTHAVNKNYADTTSIMYSLIF